MLKTVDPVWNATEPESVRIIQHYYDDDERPYGQMMAELEAADEAIKLMVTVPLLSHQHEALRSLLSDLKGGFASSRFSGGLAGSALLKYLNSKQIQLAASDFFSFVYKNGMVQQRLWEKRNMESILFRRGTMVFR